MRGWRRGDTRAPRTLAAGREGGAWVSLWRHQSSQDPCCGKGRWSLGQPPMPDAPDQGAVHTRVSAALSPAPHCMPPPAQWPMAPYSSSPEERKPHSVLSSVVSATSHRVRTLGQGPKAVVKRWVPRALSALTARRLLSLLSEGLPPDEGRRPLGLQTLTGPRYCGRADPGWGVPPRRAKLGPPGVRRERWVRRCEGVSALGMRAGDGGKQLSDPVRWPLAVGVDGSPCSFLKRSGGLGTKG